MTDTIADMLTRIRNALLAGHKEVLIPSSNIKNEIIRVLKEEGYVEGYDFTQDGIKKNIKVKLKYSENGNKAITKIQRVSKPSRRVYVNKNNIPRISGGMGIAILSTSKGIMTGTNARSTGIGGEIICTVV
ncbi:MAG: 30S ribosomal protein S8 [Candidatus Dadabacteria bacterium]|nr:30S ribosomal protein S8 [Candidatus Dadabacteria bacterium]NIQ15155.1 30S ribosomal protein S8 [Candidatus Dadabacteria bacterium]